MACWWCSGSPVDVPRREEDPDAPFDLNNAAREKGVELPKLPGLPDFTLPKLGNDLREIEIPDAVAHCVEINQCVGCTTILH